MLDEAAHDKASKAILDKATHGKLKEAACTKIYARIGMCWRRIGIASRW